FERRRSQGVAVDGTPRGRRYRYRGTGENRTMRAGPRRNWYEGLISRIVARMRKQPKPGTDSPAAGQMDGRQPEHVRPVDEDIGEPDPWSRLRYDSITGTPRYKTDPNADDGEV